MVDPMLFIKHPNEGIALLLGFVKVMQYPFQHYPFKGVAQNDSTHGVSQNTLMRILLSL
jgi:hypothetical protein